MSVETREPQHLVALRLANEVRLEAARAKRQMKTGELSLEEALRDPRLARARTFDVVAAQRRWGQRKAKQLLSRVRDPKLGDLGAKRIRDLTPRIRRRILICAADPEADFTHEQFG